MDERRLYVQLRPEQPSLDALTDLQHHLSPTNTGRMLPESELHVTLIHFGKAHEVFENIHASCGVTKDAFDTALATYIESTQALLIGEHYLLKAVGFGHFGKHGKTLVIEYEAPSALHDLHERAYSVLRQFFKDCGIADVDSFVRNDPNFVHAATFRPHLTLYKGYEGNEPKGPLPDISVQFMKLVY